MDLVDITEWADEEIRTINISLDFLYAPLEVRVRRFVPMEGDLLDEIWVGKDGNPTRFAVPPYAILCMTEAASSMAQMIDKERANFIRSVLDRLDLSNEHLLLSTTYTEAFGHAIRAEVRDDWVTLAKAVVHRLHID